MPDDAQLIRIAIPGGLAGQIFGVASALWLANRTGQRVHVQFHDMGTNISKFSVLDLVESQTARSLNITHSIHGPWPPPSSEVADKGAATSPNKLGSLASRIFFAIDQALGRSRPRLSKLILTKLKLRDAQPGSLLVGYPSDLSVVEGSWQLLSQTIAESSYPNFPRDAGARDGVAVHWRLGDYLENDFHGVIAWDSIADCLRTHGLLEKEIKVFTDSPEMARELLESWAIRANYQVVSGSIWSDLFEMTRFRYFVGTNSQVSLLAAITLLKSRNTAAVFLPRPFFRSPKWKSFYAPPPFHTMKFRYYPARFSNFPQGRAGNETGT